MAAYVVRRILMVFPLLLGISMLIFLLIQLAPGDPTMYFLPESAEFEVDPELRQRIIAELGLDQPIPIQYWRWLTSAVRGDFGNSFTHRIPVIQVIMSRLGHTFQLQLSALILSISIAIPVGVISAVKQYSVLDHTVTSLSMLGISIPNFWLALMLMLVFSLHLGWVPSSGSGYGLPALERIRYFILPTIVLSFTHMASYVRFMRSSFLEEIRQDYVRTARAKGLRDQVVLYRHVLRNAILPVITIIGMSLPRLLGGAIIVETIFAWPGIGRLSYNAVLRRDYPTIMGTTTMMATVVIMANLLTDVTYAFVDPRIKYH